MTRKVMAIALAAAALLARPALADNPPPQRSLAVGAEGFVTPAALLQSWFTADFPKTAAGRPGARDASTFRIRRAEIALKGEIVPKRIAFGVMADVAKTAPPLQDLYAALLTRYGAISIGQFKIPVSWEGSGSSGALLFPERALVSRTYGDSRDGGVKIARTYRRFGYTAGLFNGSGANTPDTNTAKDGALRLEGYPVEGILVAGVAYRTIGLRGVEGVKDRYEADFRIDRKGWLLQSEYIRARDTKLSGVAVPHILTVNGEGFYVALARSFDAVLQPCVRFGRLDPDTGTPSDTIRQLDAGLNIFARKNEAKLQLAWTRFTRGGRSADPRREDMFILAAQVAY